MQAYSWRVVLWMIKDELLVILKSFMVLVSNASENEIPGSTESNAEVCLMNRQWPFGGFSGLSDRWNPIYRERERERDQNHLAIGICESARNAPGSFVELS